MKVVRQAHQPWKECKLGDAPLEIIDGDRGKNYPSQNEFSKNGHCLFLNTKNVKENGFDFSDCQFISEERDKMLRKGKINRNDLVLTTRGTIGNIGFYNRNVLFDRIRINSGMVIIRPDTHELLPEFNYYLFRKMQNDFHVYVSGSAQPQLPIKDLNEMTIFLPPLPEQKAIAGVLSSLDDKIDLLHRQNKTLEAMAEAMFRKWFVEPCKDGLPEGWEEGAVLKYCDHCKISLNPQAYPDRGFIHFSIPSFDDNKNPVIEKGSQIQSNKYIISPNCILFSKLNPNKTKRVWLILNELDNNSICSTEFQVVKPKDKKYLYFLFGWLTIAQNYKEIASGVGGTSGSHQRIDPTDIFLFNSPVIPDEYIEKYNLFIQPIFRKIHENRKQIFIIENYRNVLLPKLMSGEVRID